MKRQGFILTEILTGMMLQVMFAVVLCGAFYMILNFSTNAQQGFAANDKGQVVIAYFDNRIRNAGLGMWKCKGSQDIRLALNEIPALKNNDDNKKNLCLPVAITNNGGDITTSGTVSYDKKTGVYSGNVLTLLYAHKDTHETGGGPVRLILLTNDQQPVNLSSIPANFLLIDNNGYKNITALVSYRNSNFAEGTSDTTNIKRYAVMESSGIPVYLTVYQQYICLTQPSDLPTTVTVYPMSEMLNLKCQKLYTAKDSNGYNFVFHELGNDGTWKNGKFYYHTKDILDLYMTLDTKPAIPIFELRVLVSEGINELGTTSRPKDWPGRWTAEFSTHKVHVSKASWKLYNLAPFFTN